MLVMFDLTRLNSDMTGFFLFVIVMYHLCTCMLRDGLLVTLLLRLCLYSRSQFVRTHAPLA